MAVERTLSIVKPDAVAKNVIGEIYSRFEKAGLQIVAAKMARLSREDAEGTLADVLGRDARKLPVPHGNRQTKHAVLASLWVHPEVDDVVPVENRAEEGGRDAQLLEVPVCLALGIEVGDLVVLHEGRHPVIFQRHPLPGIL